MKKSSTASEVARHLDVSAQRVGVMVNEGILKRSADGRFDLDACRVAYIRWLRAAPQRHARSGASTRAQELKVQKLELDLAREHGRLIEIEEVEAAVQDILSTYVAELRGVPAAATRDIELRRTVEGKLRDAIERCRSRFDQALAALRRGEPIIEDEAADAA
jgi:hypothetical protein